MYTAFYGLREKPFALSPDPRFLYLAASHREALAHLLYGIEQGEGFISVTGEVGTGKTTLCRTLLERLEGEVEVAFLFNPSRTALELLQSICAEFGLPAEGLARRSLMAQLNGFLLEKKREGRRVLLIVDEAQTLSENTLEQVRLLSNLETSRDKLIQILLLGQPELDRKLDERGLRQLRQRISVRWKLSPLAPQETGAYVRHRLAVAAGEPKGIFSDAALREIHRRTGGIPRLINQLCDRSLLGGYASRAEKIGPKLVRTAAKEIPDADRRPDGTATPKTGRPWLLFTAMCVCVGIGLLAGLEVGRNGLSDVMQSSRANRAKTEAVAATMATEAEAKAALRLAQPAVAAPPPDIARLIGPVSAEVPNDLAAAIAGRSEASNQITALAAGVFPELLASQDPLTALATTERVLLERFRRSKADLAAAASTIEALKASLERQGLEATEFEGGSLALLRRLDHPVALALRSASSSADSPASTDRWLAVVGFESDRVRVAGLMRDREVSVPIRDFEGHWSETGIVVWERFEGIPEVLAHNDRGSSVIWLQNALLELDFHRRPATGQFDQATVAAVKRFQSERGLLADGIAGPLTQIALFGRLERYPVPRLSVAPTEVPPANSTPPRDSGARPSGGPSDETARQPAAGDRG